jgi:hypothetical protein
MNKRNIITNFQEFIIVRYDYIQLGFIFNANEKSVVSTN